MVLALYFRIYIVPGKEDKIHSSMPAWRWKVGGGWRRGRFLCCGLRRLLWTHYRDRKKREGKTSVILVFALLSLTKLQMKCGSFYKFQEECCYYDPFPLTAYLKQGCQACSFRRARDSTHVTSLLALCVFRCYVVQKVEKKGESGKKYCMF